MEKVEVIRAKYLAFKGESNERFQRIWAAAEAISLGYGGVKIVNEATGIAKSRIIRGKKEISSDTTLEKDRIRKKGAGRKSLEKIDSGITKKILLIADIDSMGDPEFPLRWTTKSLRKISGGIKTTRTFS